MTQFSLLKTRRFLPLFVTQFLGAFNDNAFKNAVIMMIAYRAGAGGGVWVTAAAGIFILPFFLFSALAGQLADRHEKSRLIRYIKLAEIALMLLAAAGFFFDSVPLLFTVLFGMGVHSAFFGPLKYGILPEHLGEDELLAGNALIEAATFLAILFGTIAGGVLVLQENGSFAISGLVITAAITGWLMSRHIPPTGVAAPGLKIALNFIAETWRLVRATSGEKEVFRAIIGISWFWLVGFTFLSQFPVYASSVLFSNEQVVTLFLVTFSFGIASGALLCARLIKTKIGAYCAPLGALGMTAGILIFWIFTPTIALREALLGIDAFLSLPESIGVIAGLFIVSACGGLYAVPLYVIMQTRCDPSRRSRTVAANNIMNAFFMVAGSLATMALFRTGADVMGVFLTVAAVNIPFALSLRGIGFRKS